MQTRSGLRKQAAEQPVKQERTGHHFTVRLLGIVFLTLFTLSMILSQTFLSQRFVSKELTSSSLESTLLDEVHSGMNQYGIPSKALTKTDTDKIVRTVVKQAFAGDQLKLDLSSVTKRVANQANNELAQYGVSTSMLPSGTTTTISNNVNSAVNSRINTPQVTKVISGLHLAKTINNVVLAASTIIVLVLAVLALLGRHLLASFSWITTGALLLSGGMVAAARSLIPQLAQIDPDYSSFAVQCADDFQSVAVTWLAMLAGAAVVFWGGRVIRSALSSRR